MRYWTILLIMPMFLLLGWGINPQKTVNPSPSQDQFITSILREATAANQVIFNKRSRFEQIYKKHQASSRISIWDKEWTESLASDYGMKDFEINRPDDWDLLLFRVDTMPPSLVVAQAIYESDWGKSRFAKEGNNYFGQHCYRNGCGLVPKDRGQAEQFEVRRFDSIGASVSAYVNNLNTNTSYKPLRIIRAALRTENKKLSGLVLADGLHNYSEQGVYVKNIKKIIQKYNLQRYDA